MNAETGKLIAVYLEAALGKLDMGYDLEVFFEKSEDMVTVCEKGVRGMPIAWIGDTEIERRSITGTKLVPGFEVSLIEYIAASRWEPEDYQDKRIVDVSTPHGAAVECALAILRTEMELHLENMDQSLLER